METSTVTQLMEARKGRITPQIATVAAKEGYENEFVRQQVACGRIVIPCNRIHDKLDPIGIGRPLSIKINANIGNSELSSDLDTELCKLSTAVGYGADTVMDLSTGPDVDRIRSAIISHSSVPIGTVPLYEAAQAVSDPTELTAELLLETINKQARQGVDYMTLHAGLLAAHLPLASQRILGIVSRGGAILAKWMSVHTLENPLFSHFEDVLSLCASHDVTISLGDGLRPGCLADASDAAQFAELSVLGDLVNRCREKGVQCMVEGPGHIPLDQIEMNMKKEEELCDGAPFYILGPVVTDCAPGYDHITSAIGATLGAYYGASMLCYVTPKEHLGLPNLDDVRAGVIAYKIAAHAADIALQRPGARDRDDEVARARAQFDWERQFDLALDPAKARSLRDQVVAEARGEDRRNLQPEEREKYCTMCGPKFCSMRLSREIRNEEESL